MTGGIRHPVVRTFRFLYELGVAYHGWGLLVAIATAAAVVWNQMRAGRPEQATLFLSVAMVISGFLMISAVPLILWLRNKAQLSRIPNPRLRIERIVETARITPTGCLRDRRLTLRALDDVDRYHFSSQITGSTESDVRVMEGGELVGPLWRYSSQTYQVVFPEPLKKGREREIRLVHDIKDPHRTMRPFFGEKMNKAAEYGEFHQTLVFDSVPPESVLAEEVDSATGEGIDGTLRRVQMDGNNSYVLRVPQPVSGRIYIVNWRYPQ